MTFIQCKNRCNINGIKRTVAMRMDAYGKGGLKFCSACGLFFKTKDIFCECCKNRLRWKRRR